MSDKALLWVAAITPFILYLILTVAVLAEVLWWGWALIIIFILSFFIRIKKRKKSWLNVLNISLVICGAAFGSAIVFLAA